MNPVGFPVGSMLGTAKDIIRAHIDKHCTACAGRLTHDTGALGIDRVRFSYILFAAVNIGKTCRVYRKPRPVPQKKSRYFLSVCNITFFTGRRDNLIMLREYGCEFPT